MYKLTTLFFLLSLSYAVQITPTHRGSVSFLSVRETNFVDPKGATLDDFRICVILALDFVVCLCCCLSCKWIMNTARRS